MPQINYIYIIQLFLILKRIFYLKNINGGNLKLL